MGGDFFQGGGGGGFKLIFAHREGATTSPISQPSPPLSPGNYYTVP